MTTTIALASLPVIVPVLVLGAVLKLVAVRRGAEPEGIGGLGPAVLLPERLRRPGIVTCALVELGYAVALPLWDHPLPRWGAVVVLHPRHLRAGGPQRRRPEAGCGCFGEVSSKPVGLRSIGRAAVLGLMALAIALAPVTVGDLIAGVSWAMLGWTLAAAALVLLFSPEIDEMIARMRYRPPCEQRRVAGGGRAVPAHASAAWRAHAAAARLHRRRSTPGGSCAGGSSSSRGAPRTGTPSTWCSPSLSTAADTPPSAARWSPPTGPRSSLCRNLSLYRPETREADIFADPVARIRLSTAL